MKNSKITADVYDRAIQHGAAPGEYLGNGHFCGHIGNGNNLDSESQIYTVFEYDESLQNCDDPYSVLEWRSVSEVIG